MPSMLFALAATAKTVNFWQVLIERALKEIFSQNGLLGNFHDLIRFIIFTDLGKNLWLLMPENLGSIKKNLSLFVLCPL